MTGIEASDWTISAFPARLTADRGAKALCMSQNALRQSRECRFDGNQDTPLPWFLPERMTTEPITPALVVVAAGVRRCFGKRSKPVKAK
jgi:hypothetical protein